MILHDETDGIETAPESWPAWTDADVWMCSDDGPDPADLEWWSAESAAQDAIERGLTPRDVAADCDCEACVWARTAKYATD